MISTLAFCYAVMATPQSATGLQCAVNFNDPASATMVKFDVAGVRYGFCCEGCVPKFEKEPAKFIKAAAEKNVTTGTSLFDPVSGKHVNDRTAKGGYVDYKGVRYMFTTEANRRAFDADSAKYGTMPEKYALYCPVMNKPVKSFAAADGFIDYKGVRYFTCCAGCDEPFKANPEKFIGNAAKAVSNLKVHPVQKDRSGA